MSHIPQRKEKDCLNCGTIVQGRYCHVCGQENIVPKETFWHMVTHFFYDITHFDSNFFVTLKDLVFRPGFLSKEYMLGRRVKYLHPVRMYVFTSAIFFLLFFSLFKGDEGMIKPRQTALDSTQREEFIKRLEGRLTKNSKDSELISKLVLAKDTSHALFPLDTLLPGNGVRINFTSKDFNTFEEYDSVEKTLPPSKRDGWIMRRIVKKTIDIQQKARENPNDLAEKFQESLLHRLPYMLFVSLPLFALLLKLVYLRRKQFYYADHGVFTIHLYIFTFILLLAVFGISKLKDLTHWDTPLVILTVLLFILLFIYLYKAMRNFYGQRRGKTFLKFLLVSLFSLVMMLILFLLFVFFSAFTL